MPLSTQTIAAVAKAVTSQVEVVEFHGDATLIVPKEHILEVLSELRDDDSTRFDMLVDITAIDVITPAARYEVVYFLASTVNNARIRVKTVVPEALPHLPTAVEIWESANWYERETYDMYGVIFDGHPDLRRFYMPEDFVNHDGTPLYPLRKDFPLMGIPGTLPLPPKD